MTANVVDYLWGKSALSRLFIALRIKNQLTYQIRVNSLLWPYDGIRSLWIPTRAESVDQVTEIVQYELNKFRKQGVDKDYFELIQKTYMSGMMMDQDFYGKLLNQAMNDYEIFGKINKLNMLNDVVESITIDDGNEVISSVWGNMGQGLFGRLLPK